MEEMNALRKNGTWEVVNLPKENKKVGYNGCLQLNAKLMEA